MILTNYFIKKKIRELSEAQSARKHGFRSLKEARSILVMYQDKDIEAIEPCLETLRMLNKQVVACVYLSGTSGGALPEDCHTLDAKADLTLWGFPKEPKSREIKELKADLLISLIEPDCYALQYILLQHDCTFKVGAKRGETDLYDLSILVTDRDDIKYLFGQILFYLQSIRSK